MSMKRHLIVATLGVLVLLEGLVFGTFILTASGIGSSSEMIKHSGVIGASIQFEITAPNEAYPYEPSYVKIKVYKAVSSPVYIEFLKVEVRYSWTLGPKTLAEDKNLTGSEQWSVNTTFHLSGMHVPKPTWIGNHILCVLDFFIRCYSLDYAERDFLTFSLGLVTEKTGGANEDYPLDTQILIYTLVSTTVLFVATSIYFARRKPKVKPKLKTT